MSLILICTMRRSSWTHLLRWTMTPFLICSHPDCSDGTPCFLQDGPTKCEVDMSTVYPNLIAYATKLEAELDCTIHNMWLWGEIDMPLQYLTTPHLTHVALIVLHSLTYVCTCSVLVSYLPFTSYLKSHQCELPKQDTSLMHSSHNFTL
jgi:hypothetical protein